MPTNSHTGSAIPLGARILKLALDADALHFAGVPELDALEELRGRDGWYDPGSAGRTRDRAQRPHAVPAAGTRAHLKPGMILAADIVDPHGALLIARDQEVTVPMLGRPPHFARTVKGRHVASVLVPETMPADVSDGGSGRDELGALETPHDETAA